MAVVRELITKLGFQVERSGLQEFNRQIIGIKTKMGLAAGAIVGAVAGVARLIDNVATLSLDTDNLARRSGVAFDRFVALREVAKQFRITPEQFNSVMTEFTKGIEDARVGLGSLRSRLTDLRISITDSNGEFKKTDQIFLEIGEKFSKIENEQQRLAAFSQIFKESGANIEKLFRNGAEGVEKLAQSYEGLGQALKDQQPIFEQYEKDIASLGTELEKLSQEFVIAITPVSTRVISGLSELFKAGRTEFGGGVNGFVNAFGTEASRQFRGLVGGDSRSALQIKEEEDLKEFRRKAFRFASERGLERALSQEIIIENTMNIEVPPGSSEEQKRVVSEAVEAIFEAQSEKVARELQDNYPEVE